MADLVLTNAAIPISMLANASTFQPPPQGDCLIGDLYLSNRRVVQFVARPDQAEGGATDESATCYDLGGQIVLPRLIEPHCHLDKCHTVSRLGPVGGDLHAAIAAQNQDKANWSAADLQLRGARGLSELIAAGCHVARSHVDWSSDDIRARRAPDAWAVLGDLAAASASQLTLQRCGLIGLNEFADLELAEAAARIIANSPNAVLGVFSFNQANKRELLRNAFHLASAYALPLDFHVDEGLIAGLDGLEAIADLALELGFTQPIVCGHACSLILRNGAELERIIAKVAAAGISIISLPITNLYLQGREAGSPSQRGITRLRELAAAGVNLAIGSDNVRDAFCPLGAHDPMAALATAAIGAHLDPPYARWLPTVTTAARRALGLAPIFVDQANSAELLISTARHSADLIADATRISLEEFLSGATPLH
jgi:cytosine deaminase